MRHVTGAPRRVYLVGERPVWVPLALANLGAYALSHRGGALRDGWRVDPTVHGRADRLLDRIRRDGPGVVLFSHFAWTSKEMLAISRAVKERAPACVTVHGGAHVPRDQTGADRFLAAHPHVDVAARGEGEVTLAELLDRLPDGRDPDRWRESLEAVAGLTFRDPRTGAAVRTADRARAIDLSAFPSPYTTGFLDGVRGVALNGLLETNRGCPFGCTFCDWGGALLQKVRFYPLDKVEAEIDWFGRNRVETVFLSDANFGIVERDVAIARMFAAARARYGYPRFVYASYAKNKTDHTAEIVRVLHRARLIDTGILSLQTTDTDTLAAIRRSNIKTSKYVELRKVFEEERLPISTDLLIGLPGGTVETYKNDLQFCFDQRTHAKSYWVQVLPNSPMADPAYQERHGIRVDAAGMVVATASAGPEELQRMDRLRHLYLVTVEFGTLKHLLHFLQNDHGVRAIDVIAALRDQLDHPGALPRTREVVDRIGNATYGGSMVLQSRPGSVRSPWDAFYREVADFVVGRFQVARDSALATALRAQRAVMPTFAGPAAQVVRLRHDFAAYAAELRAGRPARLADYPPGSLRVEDPLRLRWLPLFGWAWIPFDGRVAHFELRSPLSEDDKQAGGAFLPDELSARGVLRSLRRAHRASSTMFLRALDSRHNLGLSLSDTMSVLRGRASGILD